MHVHKYTNTTHTFRGFFLISVWMAQWHYGTAFVKGAHVQSSSPCVIINMHSVCVCVFCCNAWLDPKAFRIIKGRALLNCTLINIVGSITQSKSTHIWNNIAFISSSFLSECLSSFSFCLSRTLTLFESQSQTILEWHRTTRNSFAFAYCFMKDRNNPTYSLGWILWKSPRKTNNWKIGKCSCLPLIHIVFILQIHSFDSWKTKAFVVKQMNYSYFLCNSLIETRDCCCSIFVD